MTRSYKKNSNSIIHGNLLYYSKKGKEHVKIKGHVYFTIQKIKNVKMKSVISVIV